jgi:hypothetical protein
VPTDDSVPVAAAGSYDKELDVLRESLYNDGTGSVRIVQQPVGPTVTQTPDEPAKQEPPVEVKVEAPKLPRFTGNNDLQSARFLYGASFSNLFCASDEEPALLEAADNADNVNNADGSDGGADFGDGILVQKNDVTYINKKALDSVPASEDVDADLKRLALSVLT